MVGRNVTLRQWAARCAALCGLLVAGSVAAVHAASVVYVDGNGTCAGLTPCFSTVQAGVNNAGPPPAQVLIFAGTYNESVELSTMGSAIGGLPGDITLRAITSPTNVFPPTGPAISNTLVNFPGSITLENLILKSPDDYGVKLATITGDLTLTDLVCDGNGLGGISALMNGNGDVRMMRSSFSGNLGSAGIIINSPVDALLDEVNADDNAGAGMSLVLTGALTVTRSSFSGNTGAGIVVSTATDMTFTDVRADGNTGIGGSLVLSGVMRMTNCSFSNSPLSSGLVFSTATDVVLIGVHVDDNKGGGASIVLTGAMRIRDSSFSRNMLGSGLVFSTATDVLLEDVMIDDNGASGASIVLTGRFQASNTSINHNGGTGLVLSSPTDVVFNRVTIDRNKNTGASIVLGGVFRASNSSLSGNMGWGLLLSTARVLIFENVTVSENVQDGVNGAISGARITGSHFERNGKSGMVIAPSSPLTAFRLSCNDIAGNQTGVSLVGDATVDATRNFWGAPSGPTHPSNPTGTGDSIVDGANGGSGTVLFIPFLRVPEEESPGCQGVGAPAASPLGLALLTLALLILPMRRLRRPVAQAPASH